MIEYLKDELKHLPLLIALFIPFYAIATFATEYMFQSQDVDYNNTNSGIVSTNVKGAIDELYACADNYDGYDQRVNDAESAIGSGYLTTSSKKLITSVNEIYNRFGNSNILAVASGGTGVTTAADVRTLLGAPSTSDVPTTTHTSLSGSSITGTIYRYGNVVMAHISGGTLNADKTTSDVILTIPSGYRPARSIHFLCFTNQVDSGYTNFVRLTINTSGQMKSAVALTKGKQLRGTITYIAS